MPARQGLHQWLLELMDMTTPVVLLVEEPRSVLGFGFWKLGAQLKTSYFEFWGTPDNCMGRNFLKSVGILWDAIDILCYFHKIWNIPFGLKITQDVYDSPCYSH